MKIQSLKSCKFALPTFHLFRALWSPRVLGALFLFKHTAQYLSSPSFPWSIVYICLFLAELACLWSLKCSACSIRAGLPLWVNFKIQNLYFLTFSPSLLYVAVAFPRRWHVRVDRCHLLCLLRGFPCSPRSLRRHSLFEALVSILWECVEVFSPKACISWFSSCKLLVISSSSKNTSFSMMLDKKFGIAFALNKIFSLLGPQVLCLSGNSMLNLLVPCLMVHISFSKSSWRREKNCLKGILQSCQFERHRGRLWGLSVRMY